MITIAKVAVNPKKGSKLGTIQLAIITAQQAKQTMQIFEILKKQEK